MWFIALVGCASDVMGWIRPAGLELDTCTTPVSRVISGSLYCSTVDQVSLFLMKFCVLWYHICTVSSGRPVMIVVEHMGNGALDAFLRVRWDDHFYSFIFNVTILNKRDTYLFNKNELQNVSLSNINIYIIKKTHTQTLGLPRNVVAKMLRY